MYYICINSLASSDHFNTYRDCLKYKITCFLQTQNLILQNITSSLCVRYVYHWIGKNLVLDTTQTSHNFRVPIYVEVSIKSGHHAGDAHFVER